MHDKPVTDKKVPLTPDEILSQSFKSKYSAFINEGHNAYHLAEQLSLPGVTNDGLSNNPYPTGDKRCVAWYIGWRDARDHAMRKNYMNIPAQLLIPPGYVAEATA